MRSADNASFGNILISIVVPVYNTEKYIGICLDSLLAQDVPKERYEILCIDDGSTDRSAKILDLYQENNGSILVFHQGNGGVSAARNKGIESAKGKYIWFIDSDDFVKKNSFAGIVAALEKTDCDCLSVWPFVFTDDKETALTENDELTDECKNKHKLFLWTKILKKSILLDRGIRFETDISYCEDHLFLQQAMPFIKRQETLEEKVYYYRLRENSASSQNKEKMIVNLLKIASVCKEKTIKADGDYLDAMMVFLYQNVSGAMASTAGLPRKDRKRLLHLAKSLCVFPLKYSRKYTPNSVRPFHSAKKRIIRRLNDYSYLRTVYILQVILHINHLLK